MSFPYNFNGKLLIVSRPNVPIRPLKVGAPVCFASIVIIVVLKNSFY